MYFTSLPNPYFGNPQKLSETNVMIILNYLGNSGRSRIMAKGIRNWYRCYRHQPTARARKPKKLYQKPILYHKVENGARSAPKFLEVDVCYMMPDGVQMDFNRSISQKSQLRSVVIFVLVIWVALMWKCKFNMPPEGRRKKCLSVILWYRILIWYSFPTNQPRARARRWR